MDYMWWITVVDLPVLTGLFLLVMRSRYEADRAVDVLRDETRLIERRLHEALYAHKLDMAGSYASMSHIREVERRLMGQLRRIEAKLDASAYRLTSPNTEEEETQQ